MHIEEGALQRAMGQLAQQHLDAPDVSSALSEIAHVLQGLLGADGSGVLLVDDSQVLRYVASTDTSARLLEAVQESTGRGPCVQAMVDNENVAVSDVLSDDRWPDIGQLLAANGVRAILGVPVRVGGVPVGSVNAYAREPREWDESEIRAVSTVETLVERILSAAILAERRETVIHQLQQALEARVIVERAVGVLMVVEDVDAAGAFERIRRTARSGRRPVHDVAGDVVRWKKLF